MTPAKRVRKRPALDCTLCGKPFDANAFRYELPGGRVCCGRCLGVPVRVPFV